MIRGAALRGQWVGRASRTWFPPELWRCCIPRAYLHFCPWHLQSSCIEPNPHRESAVEEWQSGHPSTHSTSPCPGQCPRQSASPPASASCQSQSGPRHANNQCKPVCVPGQGGRARQGRASLQSAVCKWQRQRSIARRVVLSEVWVGLAYRAGVCVLCSLWPERLDLI